MPTIPKDSTVLVTGASGFIAAWIIDTLLKRGYNVRASVRTVERGKHLQETFKSYGDKLQLFPTGDMSQNGAFDEAVKGVEGIIHTAATVTLNLNDLHSSEVIDPAIQGVIGILESARKHGTSVKRVIVTSSCGSIISTGYGLPEPVIKSEKDWNDVLVEECNLKGKDASGEAKYGASKTLAEKAGWEFYEKHKSQLSWDLTMLSPPWVFGPVLHNVPSIDRLNDSNKFLYNAMVKGESSGLSPLEVPSHGWIDVREAAEAHVRSLEVDAAGGERMIICAEQLVWQDPIDAVNSISPSPWPSHKEPFPKGETGERKYNIIWDTSKEKKILGLKFRSLKETCYDVLADYEKHGWN